MLVKVEFIDGTTETVESDKEYYEYDQGTEMFMVFHNNQRIMYPREFVKSIRVIGD